MEIIIRPPIIYPIVITIFFLFIFLGIFTKWNYGELQRYFSIIVAAAVFLLLFSISIQKTTIDINESGLKMSGNINVFISWDEIESANYQKNYKDAGYELVHKKWGVNLPGHYVGCFQLENKKQAYCIVSGSAADAVIIETKKDLYLLSFKNLTEVFKEISRHTMGENESLRVSEM